MRNSTCAFLAAAVAVLALPGLSHAETISDFDLSTFSFDVISYAPNGATGLEDFATASGTSNGIDWSIGPTSLWSDGTTTDGTFSYDELPIMTDRLHPSIEFTITFAAPIDSLLVAMSNNTNDAVNFGIVPTDLLGNVSVTGTQVNLTQPWGGGLVLYTGLGGTLAMTHLNTNDRDGFNFSFHAVGSPEVQIQSVPEPSTAMLFGAGLVAMVARGRRRMLKKTPGN